MARKLRIEYEGALYHVMARGNRRGAIFLDDADREVFLNTLDQACSRTGFRVYAWILMQNHYHAVIRTPKANLVEGMRWLQNTYTRRFNTRHGHWGRLFGDRYKSVLVDDGDTQGQSGAEAGYLGTLVDYVHLNPVRAGIIRASRGQSVADYPWSSVALGYAQPPSRRKEWLEVAEGLALYGWKDNASDRRRYVSRLDQRMKLEEAAKCGLSSIEGQTLQSTLRRGWYWGSQSLREKLLGMVSKQGSGKGNRNYTSSQQGKDRLERQAEDILKAGAAHFGISGPSQIRRLGRGDRRKVAIAWALWRRTSMPQRWVAVQTGLTSAPNVSQQVRRFDAIAESELPAVERRWRRINLKDVD